MGSYDSQGRLHVETIRRLDGTGGNWTGSGEKEVCEAPSVDPASNPWFSGDFSDSSDSSASGALSSSGAVRTMSGLGLGLGGALLALLG